MDPDATWAIITDVDADPHERRQAALDLLVRMATTGWNSWEAIGWFPVHVADTCEAIINAEFDHIDRLESG